MEIQFRRVRDEEPLRRPPVVFASQEVVVPTNGLAFVPTNISVYVPPGQMLVLAPASGTLSKYSVVPKYWGPGEVQEVLVPVRCGRVSGTVEEGAVLGELFLAPGSQEFIERAKFKKQDKAANGDA